MELISNKSRQHLISHLCALLTREILVVHMHSTASKIPGSDINCRFDRTCCDSQRFDTYRSAAEKVLLICKCISDTFIGTNILGAHQNVGTRFNKTKPANVLKCIKMTRIASASCKLHVIWELDRSSELFLRQYKKQRTNLLTPIDHTDISEAKGYNISQ
jgi:hypothetical protein